MFVTAKSRRFRSSVCCVASQISRSLASMCRRLSCFADVCVVAKFGIEVEDGHIRMRFKKLFQSSAPGE
eukprot:11193294-Lingulodinium_polyedra.AAC.1